MKVIIQAANQDEFDAKRVELIKSVAGSKYDVDIRPKGESKATDESVPFHAAQAEILDHWNQAFNAMIADIKHDIAEVIAHG